MHGLSSGGRWLLFATLRAFTHLRTDHLDILTAFILLLFTSSPLPFLPRHALAACASSHRAHSPCAKWTLPLRPSPSTAQPLNTIQATTRLQTPANNPHDLPTTRRTSWSDESPAEWRRPCTRALSIMRPHRRTGLQKGHLLPIRDSLSDSSQRRSQPHHVSSRGRSTLLRTQLLAVTFARSTRRLMV